MADSIHLKLPFLTPSQAQKHITHNEAIAALDTLTQLAVLDRDLTVPPSTPAEGDRYLVAASPTGAWSGHAGEIASFDGAIWLFHTPVAGWLTYVADEGLLLVWSGSAWQPAIAGAAEFGINSSADATNRLAVKSDAVLLSHDDVTPGSGDVRLKFNKHLSGGTASLLYQTNWSGRAEIGTSGDDKLHIKVSHDGSTWTDALVIDPATGNTGLGTASPVVRLDVDGPVRVKSYTVSGLPAATGAGQVAMVSNEAGGAVLAFSDGTNWRRVTDRVVVS